MPMSFTFRFPKQLQAPSLGLLLGVNMRCRLPPPGAGSLLHWCDPRLLCDHKDMVDLPHPGQQLHPPHIRGSQLTRQRVLVARVQVIQHLNYNGTYLTKILVSDGLRERQKGHYQENTTYRCPNSWSDSLCGSSEEWGEIIQCLRESFKRHQQSSNLEQNQSAVQHTLTWILWVVDSILMSTH